MRDLPRLAVRRLSTIAGPVALRRRAGRRARHASRRPRRPRLESTSLLATGRDPTGNGTVAGQDQSGSGPQPPVGRAASATRFRPTGQDPSPRPRAGPATGTGRRTGHGARSGRLRGGRPASRGAQNRSQRSGLGQWSRPRAGREVRSPTRRSSTPSPQMTRRGSPTSSGSADRPARIPTHRRRLHGQPSRRPGAGRAPSRRLNRHGQPKRSPHRLRAGRRRPDGRRPQPSPLRRGRLRLIPRPNRPPLFSPARWQPTTPPGPHRPARRPPPGTARPARPTWTARRRTPRSWSCLVSRGITRRTAS